MHGYVTPDRPELKIKEYELYKAYYCGLCKSVKKRLGQLPRLVLNYDYVFLALVLSSLSKDKETIAWERCHLHPLKKIPIASDSSAENPAIDYAADMMILLSHFKLEDDKRDEGSLLARGGLLALKRAYDKLKVQYADKSRNIALQLQELEKLEKENCRSLDMAAEPFSMLMGEVFSPEYMKDNDAKAALKTIGYHLGKWIYLIDAYDDIEENAIMGTYNPLISQWAYNHEAESAESFKARIKERVELNLNLYLAELSEIWESLKIEKNRQLTENIIYAGLLKRTEEILNKDANKDVLARSNEYEKSL